MLDFTVSAGGVPPGSYVAKFVDAESITNDIGDGVSWTWEILKGQFAGYIVGRITQRNPTLKNACGKVIVGLLGKPLTPGENLNLADCVGKTYLVVVAQTERGSCRVESVTSAPVE